MLSFINRIKYVLDHPFNRDRKVRALINWMQWQLKSRLMDKTYIHHFVNDTKVYAKRGQTGVTGNIYCGLHEWEDMCFTLHFLRANDVFVDIGANVGTYTILASGVIGARTFAFEPSPDAFLKLNKNFELNKISERITALNIGLSSSSGRMHFTTGLDTMNHIDLQKTQGSIEIEVDCLDNIVTESIALMKLDVEGHEFPVLLGAKKALSNKELHAMIIEWNVTEGGPSPDPAEYVSFVGGYGYMPVRYEPYTRTLSIIQSETLNGNILFVKDLQFCQDRVRSAPLFSVQGKRI